MKFLVTTASALIAGLALLPSTSHALVRELANCATQDGQYSIQITDNQGIGYPRTSVLVAVVRNEAGQAVANYAVEIYHGVQSVSFGRPTVIDSTTKGQEFSLQGPSTNFKNYILKTNLNLAGSGDVQDQNLNCSLFSL